MFGLTAKRYVVKSLRTHYKYCKTSPVFVCASLRDMGMHRCVEASTQEERVLKARYTVRTGATHIHVDRYL